eukprot:COSAG01_NODE_74251_length_221_cov_24.713115_1_plen_40_part_01
MFTSMGVPSTCVESEYRYCNFFRTEMHLRMFDESLAELSE